MNDQIAEQSLEDRMVSLLDSEESAPDPEIQESTDTESVEENVEENKDETAHQVVKITWNGEEVEKPLAEVVDLAQQGFDYTQKSMKLAEERRQVETYAETIKANEQALSQQIQMQQAFLKELVTVKVLDDQLAAYSQVDWQQLSDSDPVQAQKLFFSYSQLQNKKQSAVGELNGKYQQAQMIQEQRQAELLAMGQRELPRLIPDFSDEVASELQEFAASHKSWITQSMNPHDYQILWMASQYAKLVASQPKVTKKVADKPAVVKPGGKGDSGAGKQQIADDMTRLRKTGDQNLAAKLIERML